jgi:hypothetical protein
MCIEDNTQNDGIKVNSKTGSLCPGFLLEFEGKQFGLPCVYNVTISNSTCSLIVKYTGQFVECELNSLLNKTKVYYIYFLLLSLLQ